MKTDKDELERFVAGHREELDLDIPPQAVWEGVRKSLPKAKRSMQGFWRAAAVMLLLLSTGLGWMLYSQSGGSPAMDSLGDISAEYRHMEEGYKQSILQLQTSMGWEEIDREEYAWLFEELDYLDSLNQNIKGDLNKSVDRDKLVRMLIDYYEKKLKLLKKLELELNRTNHEKRTQVAV